MIRPAAALALSVLVYALPATATGLNDTGQSQCYDGALRVDCLPANTGDAATYPRQDGRFGRDAEAWAGTLSKIGDGDAGFDFTKIANDGTLLGANASLGAGAKDWACTRDNVTGLIWEVKTTDNGLRHKSWNYTWHDSTQTDPGTEDTGAGVGSDYCFDSARCDTEKFVADVNAAGLCGRSTGWRIPTSRELFSLLHRGRSSPAIEIHYFPNTLSDYYWAAEPYAPTGSSARSTSFADGNTSGLSTNYQGLVRLVHSGP